MCQTCGRYICSSVCPEYLGRSASKGSPRGACGKCGRLIYAVDKYVRKSEIMICPDCLAASTPSESQVFNIWSR